MTDASPRIYLDAELIPGASINLGKAASHHVSTVLRRHAGDTLLVFNGDGMDYLASIASVGKLVTIDIVETRENPTESPLRIHLLQGISRGDRMDTTIQKAVELGVAAITPLLTSKSQVRLSRDRLPKKQAHWQGIVIAACEQCRRSRLPRLDEPQTLPQFLANGADRQTRDGDDDDNQTRLMLDPLSGTTLGNVSINTPQCQILVGPESGLEEAEIRACHAHGFTSISLGPRVLRTETAGPCAIAVLQARSGDLC